MTVPWRAARHGRGMLVTRGRADAVAAWAARGLVPVHVVPFGDWTVVQPAGPSLGHAPYDDELQVLAGRPVPWRLRSTIGLFAVGGNAVVTMHPHGWRAVQRWVVWVPRQRGGLARPAGGRASRRPGPHGRRRPARRRARSWTPCAIPPVTPAGSWRTCATPWRFPARGCWTDATDPRTWTATAWSEPGEQHVARFHAAVDEDARLRAEMEED